MKVLDHGSVELIEVWGHGWDGSESREIRGGELCIDKVDYEVGIIEAARQSTQGSFRGWEAAPCACGWNPSEGDGEDHDPECATKKNPGDRRLLSYLYIHRHSTPFEFAGMTVEVAAPIFVIREWQRHRTFSYSEASARYAPLPDLNYIPTLERVMQASGGNKQAEGIAPLYSENAEHFINNILPSLYWEAQQVYESALEHGIPKELARLVLPVGRYSRMRVSGNLRNWLQFLTLRCDLAAQWEIRQYADAIAGIISTQFPYTYRLWENEFGEGR